MIISAGALVKTSEIERYSWAGLRRFHNVSYVSEIISAIHKVNRSQRHNVRKQAEQIRFCLAQAREYADASKVVTLATRPVLLYYSTMHLALAELLLKQSGQSSLDRARQHHRHHGLEFRIDQTKSARWSLSEAAQRLYAAPLIRGAGERFGTFELWHRTCRDLPITGNWKELQQAGSTSTFRAILTPDDERLPLLPEGGVSLLTCLRCLPTMMDHVQLQGVRSDIVRAMVQAEVRSDGTSTIKAIIHPARQDLLEEFYSHIKIAPGSYEQCKITEFSSGLQIDISSSENSPAIVIFPGASCLGPESVRFWSRNVSLNEFGYFYVALFIAGNYARYYPDMWIHDVESAAPVALAVEELLVQAEKRLPLLALSELSRDYLVPE